MSLAQGELDFLLRLAHAGENAGARVAARGDDAPQFAGADDVEAAAQIGQDAQDGQIGIGLDGEADAVVQGAERGFQAGKMVGQRAPGIDIKGRAVFFGQRADRNSLAKEPAIPVTKRMHVLWLSLPVRVIKQNFGSFQRPAAVFFDGFINPGHECARLRKRENNPRVSTDVLEAEFPILPILQPALRRQIAADGNFQTASETPSKCCLPLIQTRPCSLPCGG